MWLGRTMDDLDLEVGRTVGTHILKRFVPGARPVRHLLVILQLVGTALPGCHTRWGLALLRLVESFGSLASDLLLFDRDPNVRSTAAEVMRVRRPSRTFWNAGCECLIGSFVFIDSDWAKP